ncbi:MmcQ/YjbR family DNA-binding protein [Neobacillus sp. NRS-1170]|uniref:MmcQ/YjbR family DNA-binding protein n=1 Tax=Neobacillus sp. NRS-1170 TaxID=3233898 RepID=UPI003D2E9484
MEHHKQVSSKEGLAALDRIRQICMELPEVTEEIDGFGHTSFRVKDKPFVMMGENKEGVSAAIKTLPTTQEFLIQQPGYFKTPYIGQHGWTSLFIIENQNWEDLKGYIYEGYCRAAPKRLSKLISNAEIH